MPKAEDELPEVPKVSAGDDIAGRVARGTGWNFFGLIISRLFSVVAGVITSRWLGSSDYGKLGMITTTMRVFDPTGGVGIGDSATKFLADYSVNDKPRAGKVLWMVLSTSTFLGLLGTLAVFFFADPISEHLMRAPELSSIVSFAGIIIITYAMVNVLQACLAGLHAFPSIARMMGTEGLGVLLATVILVPMFQLGGAVAALITGGMLAAAWGGWKLAQQAKRSDIHVNSATPWEWHILWSSALPIALVALTASLAFWLGRLFLVKLDGGYAELGAITVGLQWRNFVGYIPAASQRVALGLLSEKHAIRDTDGFLRSVALPMQLAWVLMSSICTFIVAVGPWILKLHGPTFEDYVAIFSISVTTIWFQTVASLLSTVCISRNHVWQLWRIQIFSCLAFVAFSAAVVPRYGGVGLAIGNMLYYVLQILLILFSERSRVLARVSMGPGLACIPIVVVAYSLSSKNIWWGTASALPLSLLAVIVCWWACPPWLRTDLKDLGSKFAQYARRLLKRS